MKRIVSFLLVLLLAFSCSALASEAKYVAVTTSKCKVYESNSTSSTFLGTLASGKTVALLATKDGWSKIELDGKTGFVKSSYVKKTTITYYVSKSSLVLYKSYSTSSTKLSTMAYGASVKLKAVNGSWAWIKCGDQEGYCKYSGLTSTNPNNMSTTCYPKTKTIKVYAYPGSGDYKTVKYTQKMTCTAKVDSTWYRVTFGGNAYFAKKSDLSTTKYDGYSTATCSTSKVVTMDWFKSNISSLFAKGTTAVVTDVATGISWKVYRHGGSNHADVEPCTAEDTAAMKKACGSDYNTWHRRAIWVSVGGKKIAASMNCMPHGNYDITNNNFDGHHCIHFTNSKTHGTQKVDAEHQAKIQIAYKKG